MFARQRLGYALLMPPTEGRPKWDAVTHLKSVDDVTAYLEAAIDEPTSDAKLLRTVIRDAVQVLRRLARERNSGGDAR
jgi:DNA-binding phage protein